MSPRLSFTVTALTFALVIGALHLPTGLCVLAISAVVHVVCILQRPH
jgi:vacuolar-type H+-ATPase subunit I/STV1